MRRPGFYALAFCVAITLLAAGYSFAENAAPVPEPAATQNTTAVPPPAPSPAPVAAPAAEPVPPPIASPATESVKVPLPAAVAAPPPAAVAPAPAVQSAAPVVAPAPAAPVPPPAPPKMNLFAELTQTQADALSPALAEKVTKFRAEATTDKLQIIRIDPKALLEKFVMVNLPEEGAVEFEYRKNDARPPAGYIWWSAITGQGGGGKATFTVNKTTGNVNGSIWMKKNVYRLAPLGDGFHTLIKTKAAPK